MTRAPVSRRVRTSALTMSLAYMHGFRNAIDGPLVAPGFGTVSGTSIRSTASADSILLGATVYFGARN